MKCNEKERAFGMGISIKQAIQDRWDSLLTESPSVRQCLASIFSEGIDPGNGKELFRKSFGNYCKL